MVHWIPAGTGYDPVELARHSGGISGTPEWNRAACPNPQQLFFQVETRHESYTGDGLERSHRQSYYRFANPASFYQVIGNPTLEPETSRSYNAGAVYTRSRFRLGLSLYRNDVRDLIESLFVGTPRTPVELETIEQQYGIPSTFNPLLGRQMFIYQNLNRIYTRGLEVDGEASLGRGFRVRGAYTFLDARDKMTGASLTQRHRHQGFVAGEYFHRRSGLLLNLRGSLFSSYLLNAQTGARAFPYRIWDLYGSKRLRFGTTVYGAIDNLFESTDRKLRQPTPAFDRPDYGRTFRVGLRYSFTRERSH